jgi:hypothetical protein
MPKLGNKHFAYTPAGQAAYKEAKAAKAAKSGKPKEIGGPPSQDKADRQMGATDYIKKKMGYNSGGMGDFAEHTTLKEAQMAIGDILSESDISDKYPKPVWEKAMNTLVAKMWAMHKKRGGEGAPRKRAYGANQLGEIRQGQRR